MDIVKCENIEPTFKKILITGVEKSGKTSFIGTMPRPILVFAGETGAETRFAGQKDIDVVRCYDQKGERDGEGIRRFHKNFQQLLMLTQCPYKTIAVDPFSFISEDIAEEVDRTNPGMRGSANTFKYWDLVVGKQIFILRTMLKLTEYFVVTSHVTIDDDETTSRTMFMPNLNGKKFRNQIGGWFDAVLFSTTKQVGQKVEFIVYALPYSQRKAGIRVPLGCEGAIGREMPPDFQKINELLKKEIKK